MQSFLLAPSWRPQTIGAQKIFLPTDFALAGWLWGPQARRHEGGIDFADWCPDTGAMGVRTRGLDIKAGAAKLKADKAARLEAELVIDRWNRRLATGRDMLWSPTIRAALIAGTPWLDVFCPGCGTGRAIDLGPSPPSAGLGRHAGAWPAVFLVSRHGANAEAVGVVCAAAGAQSQNRPRAIRRRLIIGESASILASPAGVPNHGGGALGGPLPASATAARPSLPDTPAGP